MSVPVLLSRLWTPINATYAKTRTVNYSDVGTGAGRGALVIAYMSGSSAGWSWDSATFGGVAMTPSGAQVYDPSYGADNFVARAFYLASLGSMTGSQSVRVDASGAGADRPIAVMVYIFQDPASSGATLSITPSTPIGQGQSAGANTYIVTGTGSASAGIAFCSASIISGTIAASTPSGGTSAASYDTTGGTVEGWSKAGNGGSVTLNWQTAGGTTIPFHKFGFAITGSSAALTFAGPASSQTGTAGTVFSWAGAALSTFFSGGTTPYTYSVATGTLPTGLSLNSTTGVVSGTPTTAGSAAIVFRATDSAGTPATADSNSVSFTIAAAPDTTAPTLTGTIAISALTSSSYTATCPVATDNVAVTGYQYRINAGTWTTISAGGRSVNITGRTASTTDTLEMRAFDAVPNYSSALSQSVNLPAVATYAVSAGPCYFNTGSGPQLSVAVTWSLIYANVGGYSGSTMVDGSGTLHATTGLLAIGGLSASGAADLFVKDAAGGIYYQRVTAA